MVSQGERLHAGTGLNQTSTAFGLLDEKISGAISNRPSRASFEDFLLQDARVPVGGGEHGPYSFEGREALHEVVRLIDDILNRNLQDSTLALAGGAQFGKTILELNFAAYATSQRYLNCGLFLPDDDLVEGIIDTKFRPDVIDQIEWLAGMIKVGKAVNKSGKAVNRKNAFMVNDGLGKKATGMIMGLRKVPTSFTFDITMQDEKDDILEKNARFVRGRRTSSNLRFSIIIGTQRVHGRGQNKAWTEGSQGVFEFDGINLEEQFPEVVRCAVTGDPRRDDPKLTWAGDFRRGEEIVTRHKPDHLYYLAHPHTGQPLDRHAPVLVHRRPERTGDRNWSIRISQLGIASIGLSQIVGQFQLAVENREEMVVFRCDVLALPQSTTQALTPAVIERAQSLDPFEVDQRPAEPGRPRFGGLDIGDKSWFAVRECESDRRKRLIYAASIPSSDVVARAASLFRSLGLQCLLIDQRPEPNISRSVALELNGLNAVEHWPEVPALTDQDAYITFPGGLVWDGKKGRWINLKCAVVNFSRTKLGSGVVHGFDQFPMGGHKKFVPLITCNRQETIDVAVRELLTPAEGVVDYLGGVPREEPLMLLPRPGLHPIVETLVAHLITGSEREKKEGGEMGNYVDECANHLLLADAYSALAEGEVLNRTVETGVLTSAQGIVMGGNRAGTFRYAPRRLQGGRR